ncbi:ABC transporter substrate-binding protein [Martelella alba]|uniref:ABC transporter substrate-binding protein n=1 Tax=Martelella alba TaxID=2590451 RepID=A0ABY2SP87_9HYPH|nr:ABC transporter substrate-binding protein [Martelella alba]TKI07821.1 ABC transporter substrate-binding protein [Martelella alba]
MALFDTSRRFAVGAGLAVTLLGAFGEARAADDVAIQLDWVVRGDHAPFFVARDKGFFTQNGIHITAIRKGSGTTDALRLVANGNADFGFGDLPTLITSRAQGVDDKALIAVNQKTPLAMISLKAKHPLTKPADLKGLNIGVHPSGSTFVFLKAFLAANGMSLNDIKQSTVSPPYESFLLMGRVDSVPGYVDAEVPELEAKAGGPGTLSILYGADYGYDAYGSGVFAADKTLAEHPDLVKRFVKAYMQGFVYTLDHPKEAVALLVKDNPEYRGKEQVLAQELAQDIQHTMLSPATKSQGLGIITADQWQKTADILMTQGVLAKDADYRSAFDASYLLAANPVKR